MGRISTASFRTSRLGATRMSSLSTLQTPKLETAKRRTPTGLARGKFLSWGLVYVTLYCVHALKPAKSLSAFHDSGNRDTRLLPFPIQIPETSEVSKVSLQREIDGRKPPLIQRYGSFRGFGTREFEMQRLQDSSSFKSLNSDMESRVRDRRLLGAWIQRSTDFGYRDFVTREGKVSCLLVPRMPKRRNVDRQPRVPSMDGDDPQPRSTVVVFLG
jgi:hypothetical protein